MKDKSHKTIKSASILSLFMHNDYEQLSITSTQASMAENTKRFVFLHVKSSIAKTMEEMDKIAILILWDHHQSGSDTLGKKKKMEGYLRNFGSRYQGRFVKLKPAQWMGPGFCGEV